MDKKDDLTVDQSEKIEAVLAPLKDTYKLFIRHYCRFLSKTAAAKYAGYSERSAAQAGYDIHNREEVRAAINAIFKLTAFDPEDNIAGIKRLAEINTSDYFTYSETWETERKRVPIQTVIDQVKLELKIEDRLFMEFAGADMGPIEKTTMLQMLKRLQMQLARLKAEQRLNPAATKFITVDVLKREKVLDLDKVIADQVPIKSIKHKEHGVEVELYSSAEARVNLARIAGSFEKDNIRNPLVNLTAPVVNAYYNAAPPLSEDESQVDTEKNV